MIGSTRRRRLGIAIAALTVTGALAWLWPTSGSRPLTAWFPGESHTRGALMRAMTVDPDVKLVAIHAPNILVLQSDSTRFPLRLLTAGALPFSVRASEAICVN